MRAPGLSRTPREIAPNMTALVDVVMVILIFLMLAGAFSGDARFLKSRTIVGVGGGAIDPRTFTVDVVISQSSDGSPLINAGRITTRDVDVLLKELTGDLHAYQAAGTTPEQIQVVLHPTGKLKYANLIKVYDAVLRSGFSRVAFAKSK